MFSYSCPSCAQTLLAPPERAGQRTICPKCLKPLTIPSPSQAEDGDPHDGLLHAGPLVDDLSDTNPIIIPAAPAPTPRPVMPDPTPVLQLADPPARKPAPPPPEPVVLAPLAASRVETVRKPAPPPEPATPPPARTPARVAVAVPAPPRRAADTDGRVTFTPTGMAGVDLAADLAADLTMRMKPPPELSDDQTLTTLAWVGLTALAGVLWVAGVLYEPVTLPFVALIGVLLTAVGYLWAAYAARGMARLAPVLAGAGVVAGGLFWVIQRQVNASWADLPSNLIPALALPVVSVVCAFPLGVLRFRPLRYILTGELLVLLFVVSPAARTATQKGLERLQPTPSVVAPPPLTPGERVRTLAERKTTDGLLTALAELADPEAAKVAPPEARAELGDELAKLAGPAENRGEVRTAALAALAVWQPDATRTPVLIALRSADPTERRVGLALAGRWADPEVAAAVAARLADRLDSADAQAALRQIGGPAEGALLPLLKTEDRSATLLVIMELLEAVGGPKAVAALREVERGGPGPSVRDEAKQRADALTAKLKK